MRATEPRTDKARRRKATAKTRPNASLYSILGVRSTASQREIVAAYRKLAQRLHPDHNSAPDAALQFHAVHNAYQVLGSPRHRAEYDATNGASTNRTTPSHSRKRPRSQGAKSPRKRPSPQDRQAPGRPAAAKVKETRMFGGLVVIALVTENHGGCEVMVEAFNLDRLRS